ncbi:hypothetical protein GQR58_013977 [Nymphon striatum]|nr:hypothetical protein GQR58_013977 [Nymphon striatum]
MDVDLAQSYSSMFLEWKFLLSSPGNPTLVDELPRNLVIFIMLEDTSVHLKSLRSSKLNYFHEFSSAELATTSLYHPVRTTLLSYSAHLLCLELHRYRCDYAINPLFPRTVCIMNKTYNDIETTTASRPSTEQLSVTLSKASSSSSSVSEIETTTTKHYEILTTTQLFLQSTYTQYPTDQPIFTDTSESTTYTSTPKSTSTTVSTQKSPNEVTPTTTSQPETTTPQPKTTTSKPQTTISQPETSTSQPETTLQPKTTTSQPETTTSLLVTTTQPEITTSQPETTTTSQPETSTLPLETTSQTETTTLQPETTTTQPETTTIQPLTTTSALLEKTTSQTETTTSQPETTTTSQPGTTTTQPLTTTSHPEKTTSQLETTTTSQPETTTKQPLTTTSYPETTTSQPETTTTSQPGTTTTQPLTTTSQPETTTSQSETTTSQPLTTTSQPLTTTTQPLTTTTQPLTTTTQLLTTTSQPITTTTSQPLTTTSQPLTTTTQPLTTTSQPLTTTTSQPLTTTSQPLTTTSQPLTTTTSQPLTTTSQPLTTTTQSLTTTSQPLTTTSQPLTTTTQPLTITSQPLTTTSQPLTTTSQPLTTTSQPLTTTSTPLTTTLKPQTTTTQPQTTTIAGPKGTCTNSNEFCAYTLSSYQFIKCPENSAIVAIRTSTKPIPPQTYMRLLPYAPIYKRAIPPVLEAPSFRFVDPGFDEEDLRWVGAWWIGFIVMGIQCFIIGILMGMFPQSLKSLGSNKSDLAEAKRINDANLWKGYINIISSVVGLLGAGIIIKVFKPSSRKIAVFLTVSGVLNAVLYFSVNGITCGNPEIKKEIMASEPQCMHSCNCDNFQFDPICDLDSGITYFSPCHANCKEHHIESGNVPMISPHGFPKKQFPLILTNHQLVVWTGCWECRRAGMGIDLYDWEWNCTSMESSVLFNICVWY